MHRRCTDTTEVERPPEIDPVDAQLGAIAAEHARLPDMPAAPPDVAYYRATARKAGRHVHRLRELVTEAATTVLAQAHLLRRHSEQVEHAVMWLHHALTRMRDEVGQASFRAG